MKIKYTVSIITLVVGLLIAVNVFAVSYDLKNITPDIQAALDNRRARFSELQSYKGQGIIGEGNTGYITVLTPNTAAHALAAQENADRRLIYSAIAEQNGLSSALSTIESVFAGVQRSKAQPGERIQLENGNWVNR